MLPRYAPDASQLVCCLCGVGRLLETDARAAVGPCLRICVIGQPWALAVTFKAGRDSGKEWGMSASELWIKCHCTNTFISASRLYLASQGWKLYL